MMKQGHFDIFVYFSILTFCSSDRLIYHCDFDSGLTSTCRFDSTPGAPLLETSNGITSLTEPRQPLSDVKSTLSPTTPNNELCQFPYPNLPQMWSNYFCQRNSETNYTCPTRTGTGYCMTGRYGLVQISRNGDFAHMYTAINNVENYVNSSQCLDFYYYITDTSYNAKIDVGWLAGLAPNSITEVQAQPENKWQNYRFTFATPPQPSYKIWFQMIRDGGNAPFFFALDEIKIFDGPCEFPTTMNPEIATSTKQTGSITVDLTSSRNGIPTDESMITSFEPVLLTNISTRSSSSSTTTTTQLPFTFTNFPTTTANHTNIETQTTAGSVPTALLLDTTNKLLTDPLIFINGTFLPTIETGTEGNLLSSTLTTTSTTSTTSTIYSDISPEKSNLPLILGLALGIGLAATLIIIGAPVYYFKVVKPKQKVVVRDFDNTEIPMKRTTRFTNNTK